MPADVKVNLKPLEKVAGKIPRRVFRQWAVRYRTFSQLRFDRLSKGGGIWAPLAKSTLAARRRKTPGGKLRTKSGKSAFFTSKTRKVKKSKIGAASAIGSGPAILRDTNVMFSGLNPTLKRNLGAEQTHIANGIRVGYGGGARHWKGERSKNTIAEIASYHQSGSPEHNLPQRKIIVSPDAKTMDDMADDVLRAKGLESK